MANQFLVTQREVALPVSPPQESPVMADADVFPRYMYPAGGPTEPDYGGRAFASQEELDAASAEGPWFPTPQAAQAAKPTPPPVARPTPTPEDEEPTTPRSRR